MTVPIRPAPSDIDDYEMGIYQAALILLLDKSGGSFTFTAELFNAYQASTKKKAIALEINLTDNMYTLSLVDENEFNEIVEDGH